MDAVNDGSSTADFRERLQAIEQALDTGAYAPGPWQRLVTDLRRAPRTVRVTLADDLGRISRKLHLRNGWYTVSVTAGLCIESLAATLGGIALTLAMSELSNVLAIMAMILWTSSFQPLIKVGFGTALGIKYDYAYLFGSIEPRFKTDFGSYLALSSWKRMMFHLSGTVGSPLGAALVAVLVDGHLRIATPASWGVFWILVAVNAAPLLVGFTPIARIRKFRLAETSGGLAAIEFRNALQGAG